MHTHTPTYCISCVGPSYTTQHLKSTPSAHVHLLNKYLTVSCLSFSAGGIGDTVVNMTVTATSPA